MLQGGYSPGSPCKTFGGFLQYIVAIIRNSEVETRFFAIAQNDNCLFVILDGANA
jgi:hypothetical protein